MRKCKQIQCEFNNEYSGNNKNRSGSCRACVDCNAKANMINENCSACLACETLPNMLRFDVKRLENELLSCRRLSKVKDLIKEGDR